MATRSRAKRGTPGYILRELRALLGETQAERARALGVSKSFYCQLEGGRRRLRDADLIARFRAEAGIEPGAWFDVTAS